MATQTTSNNNVEDIVIMTEPNIGTIASTTTTDGGVTSQTTTITNIFGSGTVAVQSDNATGELVAVTEASYYDPFEDADKTVASVIFTDAEGNTEQDAVAVIATDDSTVTLTETLENGNVSSESITVDNPDGSADTSSFAVNSDGTVVLTDTHTDEEGNTTTDSSTFDLGSGDQPGIVIPFGDDNANQGPVDPQNSSDDNSGDDNSSDDGTGDP